MGADAMLSDVPMRRAVLRATLVTTLAFAWTSCFWFQPARRWPVSGDIWRAVQQALVEWTDLPRMLVWALRGWVWVGAAILLALLLRQRLPLLGWGPRRTPMRRLLLVAFLAVSPILISMGLREGMQADYAEIFRPNGWRSLLAHVLSMVAEHAWIQGVILGLALPAGLLDRPPPEQTGPLASMGLGYPAEGPRTVSGWLGIPAEAWPALVGQALIFFAVHARKDISELVTSLPGGLALGWITLRARSCWPGFLLHLGTGGLVLLTIALARG